MSCTSTQQVRFQLRRGDNNYWIGQAAIAPLAGEPCFNTTSNQLKIGDGTKPWGELEYINVAGPIGTYTNLETRTTVGSAITVTRAANSNNFTWTGLSGPAGSGNPIQFAGSIPDPLTRFTTYYTIGLSNSGSVTTTTKLSATPDGPNVILNLSYVIKSGNQVTVGGTDVNFLGPTVTRGQALIFTEGTIASPIVGDTIYYLDSIVTAAAGSPLQAIIRISGTFLGPAIN